LATRAKFLTKALPLLFLVLITLLAYLNAWPDNLLLDDKVFSAAGRYSDMSLSDMSRFFSEDLWALHGGNSGLYRPLLVLSFALDAYIFGDWAAGYHLTNIILHLLVTLLVFGFLRHLLLTTGGQSPIADYTALMAAAIFSVHPVHTEVVNSIFNRSDIFVSIGVVGGLWWFLRTLESSPLKAWAGVGLTYFLILFFKEISAVFPALIIVMLWLFTPGNWRIHVRKSLPVFWLLIPLAIYFLFRNYALETPAAPGAANAPGGIHYVASNTGLIGFGWDRVLPAFSVWMGSLKKLLWPYPLQLYYGMLSKNYSLIMPLHLLLAGLAIMAYRKNNNGLIAGLAFFYIAFLPASRLIGEIEITPHLADRYLYLPSIGGAIALAFGLQWLSQRFNFRAVTAAVLVVIMMMIPATLARNAEWASDLLLYESEYRQVKKKGRILHLVVGANLREHNYSRATEICDEQIESLDYYAWKFANRCGVAHFQMGQFDKAERAFLIAVNDKKNSGAVHQKLANMYLYLGQGTDARKHFELSVETEINPVLREYRWAYMLIRLYPNNENRLLEAKSHLEQTLLLQPKFVPAREMLALLNEVLVSD